MPLDVSLETSTALLGHIRPAAYHPAICHMATSWVRKRWAWGTRSLEVNTELMYSVLARAESAVKLFEVREGTGGGAFGMNV